MTAESRALWTPSMQRWSVERTAGPLAWETIKAESVSCQDGALVFTNGPKVVLILNPSEWRSVVPVEDDE